MGESELIRIRLCVRGRVQGVGFRRFVWRQAQVLPICGWVKNNPDGSVEIEAAGACEHIGHFISDVRQGSFLSRVDEIEEIRRDRLPLLPEVKFEIR
jgi:acylphosphatase